MIYCFTASIEGPSQKKAHPRTFQQRFVSLQSHTFTSLSKSYHSHNNNNNNDNNNRGRSTTTTPKSTDKKESTNHVNQFVQVTGSSESTAQSFLEHYGNDVNKAVSAYLDNPSPSWLPTKPKVSSEESSGFGFIGGGDGGGEDEEKETTATSSSGFGFMAGDKDEDTTTTSSGFGFMTDDTDKEQQKSWRPRVEKTQPSATSQADKKNSLVPEAMMYKGTPGTLNLKFGKKKRRKRKKKIGIGRGSTPVSATPSREEEKETTTTTTTQKQQTQSLLSGLTIHKTPTRAKEDDNLDPTDPIVQALRRGDITREEFDAIKSKQIHTPDQIDRTSPEITTRKSPPPPPVRSEEKSKNLVDTLHDDLDTLNDDIDYDNNEGDEDFLQGLTLRRQSSDSSSTPPPTTQDDDDDDDDKKQDDDDKQQQQQEEEQQEPTEIFVKTSRNANARLLDLEKKTNSLVQKLNDMETEILEIEMKQNENRNLQNKALESEDYDLAEKFETDLQNLNLKTETLKKQQQDSKLELASLHASRNKIHESRLSSISLFLNSVESSRSDRESKLETMISQFDARKSRLEITQNQYESHVKSLKEDREQIEEQVESSISEFTTLRDDARAECTSLELEIERLRSMLQEKENELKKQKKQLKAAQVKISAVEDTFKSALRRLTAREVELKSERKEFEEAETETKAMEERLAAVTKIHKDEAVSVEIVNELKESLSNLKRFDSTLVSASSKETAIQVAMEARESAEERLRESKQNLTKLESSIVSQASALEEIEGKLPALEKEKKRYVQSRQFRDAARVAKTIKSLQEQRESELEKKLESEKSIETTREEIQSRQSHLEKCEKEEHDLIQRRDLEMIDVLETDVRLCVCTFFSYFINLYFTTSELFLVGTCPETSL